MNENVNQNFELNEDQLNAVSGGASGQIGKCPMCGSPVVEIADPRRGIFDTYCTLCGYRP